MLKNEALKRQTHWAITKEFLICQIVFINEKELLNCTAHCTFYHLLNLQIVPLRFGNSFNHYHSHRL